MFENPSVTIEETSDSIKAIRLAGDVSVFQATELHKLAMLLAKESGDVRLECGELRSIDLAAGQILLSLQQVISSQDRHLNIQPPSKELVDLFTFVGIAPASAAIAEDRDRDEWQG